MIKKSKYSIELLCGPELKSEVQEYIRTLLHEGCVVHDTYSFVFRPTATGATAEVMFSLKPDAFEQLADDRAYIEDIFRHCVSNQHIKSLKFDHD